MMRVFIVPLGAGDSPNLSPVAPARKAGNLPFRGAGFWWAPA
jgi:hypothetical protein